MEYHYIDNVWYKTIGEQEFPAYQLACREKKVLCLPKIVEGVKLWKVLHEEEIKRQEELFNNKSNKEAKLDFSQVLLIDDVGTSVPISVASSLPANKSLKTKITSFVLKYFPIIFAGRKIYQHCDKCNDEVLHVVGTETVVCTKCQWGYKI